MLPLAYLEHTRSCHLLKEKFQSVPFSSPQAKKNLKRVIDHLRLLIHPRIQFSYFLHIHRNEIRAHIKLLPYNWIIGYRHTFLKKHLKKLINRVEKGAWRKVIFDNDFLRSIFLLFLLPRYHSWKLTKKKFSFTFTDSHHAASGQRILIFFLFPFMFLMFFRRVKMQRDKHSCAMFFWML